jgi:hypothetical protein
VSGVELQLRGPPLATVGPRRRNSAHSMADALDDGIEEPAAETVAEEELQTEPEEKEKEAQIVLPEVEWVPEAEAVAVDEDSAAAGAGEAEAATVADEPAAAEEGAHAEEVHAEEEAEAPAAPEEAEAPPPAAEDPPAPAAEEPAAAPAAEEAPAAAAADEAPAPADEEPAPPAADEAPAAGDKLVLPDISAGNGNGSRRVSTTSETLPAARHTPQKSGLPSASNTNSSPTPKLALPSIKPGGVPGIDTPPRVGLAGRIRPGQLAAGRSPTRSPARPSLLNGIGAVHMTGETIGTVDTMGTVGDGSDNEGYAADGGVGGKGWNLYNRKTVRAKSKVRACVRAYVRARGVPGSLCRSSDSPKRASRTHRLS